MAVIYLQHFIHGTKVAVSDLEAEADEKNGWVRFELPENVQPVTSESVKNTVAKTKKQ